jgi:ABC-type sugar transport system ATPase subunit
VDPQPLLHAEKISRSFPGVRALDRVTLSVMHGEVHAVVGENGAGKSTLMNILSGSLPADGGGIQMEGRRLRFQSPRDAEQAGIAIIHQELSLVPHMSVAENIFLGRPPRTPLGTVAWRSLHRRARALLEALEIDLDLRAPAASFPIGIQQMIEIAKALSLDASLIIMDEPTSSLSESEAERLFHIIERLRAKGKGIVYITHRMEEIYRIADRITVLRDGRLIGTRPARDLERSKLISWMVGREVEDFYERTPVPPGALALQVKDLSLRSPSGEANWVDRVSLSVRAGEIVGLAGLLGAGNSELLGAIFGRYGRRPTGTVEVKGRAVAIHHPLDAIRAGLALLTNDRKDSGLVMPLSVAKNMALASLRKACRFGCLTQSRERALAEPLQEALNIRVPSIDGEAWTLSGGNQQKVILGKWLLTEPEMILLDEPTRGIDVGAKAEIYRLMNRWTGEGKAILLITSELPELLAMSDRVLVMRRGNLSAEFTREEATPEKVMAAAV